MGIRDEVRGIDPPFRFWNSVSADRSLASEFKQIAKPLFSRRFLCSNWASCGGEGQLSRKGADGGAESASRPKGPEIFIGLVGAAGTDLRTVGQHLKDELHRVGYTSDV